MSKKTTGILATTLLLSLILFILFGTKMIHLFHRWSGEMVDVGGYSLHLECEGTGSPVVILEAGLTYGLETWKRVFPAIANSTRVCAYDRAGIGASDSAKSTRRTTLQLIAELHTLLERAGVPPPFVLVGHSFGALNMRLYASKYPDRVVGMVLVDPSHENQTQIYADLMSPDRRDRFLQYESGTNPEHVDVITSADQVRAASPVKRMPYVVITAEHQTWLPDTKEIDRARNRLQLKLVQLVPDGVHIRATGSDHHVQADRPELVIQAIESVLAQVRKNQRRG